MVNSRCMSSNLATTVPSSSASSFAFMGRTRQNTRTDPLASSTALWICFRLRSTSFKSHSVRPASMASLIVTDNSCFASWRSPSELDGSKCSVESITTFSLEATLSLTSAVLRSLHTRMYAADSEIPASAASSSNSRTTLALPMSTEPIKAKRSIMACLRSSFRKATRACSTSGFDRPAASALATAARSSSSAFDSTAAPSWALAAACSTSSFDWNTVRRGCLERCSLSSASAAVARRNARLWEARVVAVRSTRESGTKP
mmetsp:Transcript_30737/g.88752  ORF Transcript_30737/g.88752 Transcript_30737/m.88752 type:complete len:260 (+) Transcript_30737:206-985(+)